MIDVEHLQKELDEIKKELTSLKEGSRAYRNLSAEKAEIEARLIGSGAIAQGDNTIAIAQDGIGLGGDVSGTLIKGDANQVIQNSTVIVAGEGAQIVIGEQSVEMKASLRKTSLGRYLKHIIAHTRYLQLQGIRSGGKLVNIELEQIYITLRTTQQRTIRAEDEWLESEVEFAPGEMHQMEHLKIETINVRAEQALAAYHHLVVLGDPGSGKTTFLRYLALLYGRDFAQGQKIVKDKLGLDESGYIPVLLHLRQIGQFLKVHHPKDDGTEGHALLIDFLFQMLKSHKLDLPKNLFEEYLDKGQAVVLLDGMDEVASTDMRSRVARLVEAFTLAYPKCRFVVTSRIVGYNGAARLGADYVTTTVRDFTFEDVRLFLTHWHRLVAIGQMGVGEDAEIYATGQVDQLLETIQANERVRELAINPLMLTVIALVHRDRVKLPDRRAELYAEAVDVLLGKWDEARGVDEIRIFEDRPFDAGDRRLLLQQIALFMHERQTKEIDSEDLYRLLSDVFTSMSTNQHDARKAAENFQRMIEERTGLLTARGDGVFSFSHMTFQEYMTALAVAARDDYIEYTLKHSDNAWWHEVILLEAGFLSTQSKERTTNLIQALARKKKEPIPYHNLVLALECIRDAGSNRVENDLQSYLSEQLHKNLRAPIPTIARILGKWGGLDNWVTQRAEAIQALTRVGSGYWSGAYGEPEWVTIPASEFWMGGEEKYDGNPIHKLYIPKFQIARVPVTNYQYEIFVKATNHPAPDYWDDNRTPKGLESHPVVNVTWYDAVVYCEWLSSVLKKVIRIPSEAEWEKAARGGDSSIIDFGNVESNKRAYAWGDKFKNTHCNTKELGMNGTTPVGIFLEGKSSYGVLDMIGNIWEWTRTLYGYNYPYIPDDGREDMSKTEGRRILRGGGFFDSQIGARCASRNWNLPNVKREDGGFRLVVY